MAVVETFSQRQARLRGDLPDVYVYDTLPRPLRVQLVQIFQATIGAWTTSRGTSNSSAQRVYEAIVKTLHREYGVFTLNTEPHTRTATALAQLQHHILKADAEKVLDAVELCCQHIDELRADSGNTGFKEYYDGVLAEVNTRFKRAGAGYEYTNGQVIRVDSALVHAEAVKPALALLADPLYAGAQAEFLGAYAHYRSGKTKEALADALKSLESTMKIICNKRGWVVAANATSKDLIAACYTNGLIPAFWQTHFGGLRSVLESGVPTARNRTSGHGQGSTVQDVPDYLASYVLHMTASTIVFLVNAEKALP